MSNCFADFLQKAGLYESVEINETNITELCELIGGKVRISEYCVECKEHRVFGMRPIEFPFEADGKKIQLRSLADELSSYQSVQGMSSLSIPYAKNEKPIWQWTNIHAKSATRIMVFPFICAMDNNHHIDYIVRTNQNTMVKIGQYPSVADLQFPELNEFRKEIDEPSRRELRRAIGLYAQGIGVGSYVYLRRIFERILEIARQKADADKSIDLSNYASMRVSDRIKLLKDYLPDLINSSPVIYGIVSKGIHELSEDDCLKYFPILQDSIFMILRQWAQKRKEQETARRLEASISAISAELGNNSDKG